MQMIASIFETRLAVLTLFFSMVTLSISLNTLQWKCRALEGQHDQSPDQWTYMIYLCADPLFPTQRGRPYGIGI